MDKGESTMKSNIERKATEATPTQRRMLLMDSNLSALKEGDIALAEYLEAQFESLINLKPLINHSEWFNHPGDLRIENMRSADDLKNTAVLAKAEALFDQYSKGELNGIDQDPQTQLNFFRGNFHSKIIMAFLFVTNKAGIGIDLEDWLGDGYHEVLHSLDEYRSRIEVRKKIGSVIPYLKDQITLNAKGLLNPPLDSETINNYMQRIVESSHIIPVPQDEIMRSFSLAELMLAFIREKLGKGLLNEGEKIDLIARSIHKLESPEPVPTEPLRKDEFAQQPI